jgi:hypothetical protein
VIFDILMVNAHARISSRTMASISRSNGTLWCMFAFRPLSVSSFVLKPVAYS